MNPSRQTMATPARCFLLVPLLLAACTVSPPVPSDVRAELARSGSMRAAINYGNPVLAHKDAETAELRGVAVQVSRELARRIDVRVDLIGYETVGKLLAGLKAGEWDVALLAVDQSRAAELTFTAPYMEVEVTYLVPAHSDVRGVSQVDRPGMRIAVQEKNAADLFLTRNLKTAMLMRAATTTSAFALLTAGSADAFADNRQHLLSVAEANPGYRLLEGRFTTIPHALAVPVHRKAAAEYLRGFVEDVKASGFVARALEDSATRGVVVAPQVGR